MLSSLAVVSDKITALRSLSRGSQGSPVDSSHRRHRRSHRDGQSLAEHGQDIAVAGRGEAGR
jgi:hypothetical protein